MKTQKNHLARLDQKYLWHPFTQMQDWLKREPIVIVSGKGATLRDANGKDYLDANSSIWTNLHGHQHPAITSAIQRQLGRIAHSSALGLANEPAALLAEKLVGAARLPQPDLKGNPKLEKVFLSDNGSTAMEVALKLAYEYARRSGLSKNPKFLSLEGAYHGDTVGAVSLGHIDLFHKAYGGLLFRSDKIPAPYCYRCPFNKAKPQRADAREYVQCKRECVGLAEKAFSVQRKKGNPYAGFVFEPLMQGAAGMIPQPKGYLRDVAEIARSNGAQLIADEVMTGFGRTGVGEGRATKAPPLFASHQEGVQPDFMALAKGLTGGYLPMAATLTTQRVFDAFLGKYEEFKTFFHGHSFTGNQLGAAAALASMEILQSPKSIQERRNLETTLRKQLQPLWSVSQIGDMRQVGLVAGIELVKNWQTKEPFALRERAGIRVCEAMAKRGVLTRPIGNVIVLMPPYCTTASEVVRMVSTLGESVRQVFGKGEL
ncbi:MAG: adenosylmethionine--8-amino-7-oxononanoate aminotransferase BioA [Verrucomicrobiales bacterium]|nr:adenosylmethionine--8-amino-7-oxononanoate aminotransferase BioA [Verrucomicrobiales bacterium]